VTLTRRVQLASRLCLRRLGVRLCAPQFVLGTLQGVLGAFEILLGPLPLGIRPPEVFLRAFAFGLGPLEICLGALVIRLRLLQCRLGAFAIGVRVLKILLAALALRVRACQIVRGSLTLGLRPGQFVLRRLPIGVRLFTLSLNALEIGLRALQVGLSPFALRLKAFDLGARPFAFRGHRFIKLALGMYRSGRGRLFRFHPRARRLTRERSLDVGTRRGDFSFEARSPLRVHRVELAGPSLFRVFVRPGAGFLEGLLVCLCEIAELLEFRLQPGPNAVDDSAKMFLGHLLALSEARSD